jgi:hypothetical protein
MPGRGNPTYHDRPARAVLVRARRQPLPHRAAGRYGPVRNGRSERSPSTATAIRRPEDSRLPQGLLKGRAGIVIHRSIGALSPRARRLS